VRVGGRRHVGRLACDLGSEHVCTFEQFVAARSAAAVSGDVDRVHYNSPDHGEMTAGWEEPLVVAGQEVNLGPYPRFDNPWLRLEFGECVPTGFFSR